MQALGEKGKHSEKIVKEEEHVNRILVEGAKLGQLSLHALEKKLHRNIVSTIWEHSKFIQVGRRAGLLISSYLVTTRIINIHFLSINNFESGPASKMHPMTTL